MATLGARHVNPPSWREYIDTYRLDTFFFVGDNELYIPWNFSLQSPFSRLAIFSGASSGLRQAAYAWDEGAAFHIGNIEPVIGDGYTGKAPGNLYSPYELLGEGTVMRVGKSISWFRRFGQ